MEVQNWQMLCRNVVGALPLAYQDSLGYYSGAHQNTNTLVRSTPALSRYYHFRSIIPPRGGGSNGYVATALVCSYCVSSCRIYTQCLVYV